MSSDTPSNSTWVAISAEELAQLHHDLAAMTARAETAERDSARLDWFERYVIDNASRLDLYPIGVPYDAITWSDDENTILSCTKFVLDKYEGPTLRDAIDAAREGK